MAQVKKEEVERAITDAAYKLFKANGYSGVSMPQVAKIAKISTANIYVYFDSKVDLLLTVYKIWFSERVNEYLEQIDLCETPEQTLRRLFTVMWQKLPTEDNGFCGVLIEALSNRDMLGKYEPKLRLIVESELLILLAKCLPKANHLIHQSIINILIMAFDGYALNYHLSGGKKATKEDIETICTLLFNAYGH